MAAVVKQDSNFTGLSYAVETAPGVVDGSVTWLPLEPNSYKTFGGEVKTKARQPISASRQLKKGTVVDLDANGGFVQDLTADNFQDPAQCFMYALLRKKNESSVTVVEAAAYDTDGTSFVSGDIVFAKGFDASTNNGVKTAAGNSAVKLTVNETLQVASGQKGTVSRVGFQFPAGAVEIDTSGSLPALKSVVSQVAATGTLTSDATNVSDTDTVTIGGKVYTFQSSLTDVDGHVKIGADAAGSLVNLFHAINASGGTVGTDYATMTVANKLVTATNPSGTTVVLTAKAVGAQGNSIATVEGSTHLSFGAATLASGAGARAFTDFGLVPGEYVFVGGDATNTSFAEPVDNGFCRIRSIAADSLGFDKTQAVMVDDNGSGKSLKVYFGRVLKNESDPRLIVKRGIQIERTLGAPDDAQPDQIQAEYLVRSIADECVIDMSTADIIHTEMNFVCNTNELRSADLGLKDGARPVLLDTDAFNSTSDVAYTKMAIVTGGDAAPDPLFSYFTDLSLDIKNNVKQNKAIKVLGAFDSTPGFFSVTAAVTAYFTDVREIQAVRDNATVTIETHLVKENRGITFDLPCITMSKALADVKLNEAIMIPLDSQAAAGTAVDPALNHTLLWVFWDYLPNLAG